MALLNTVLYVLGIVCAVWVLSMMFLQTIENLHLA